MRIERIKLHNVGPYAGEHQAVLSPKEAKPVVLFGGLNGAGKTTILEAIQLALYGNLSEPFKRSGLSFPEYLRRLTNRSTPGTAGASVELEFTVTESGYPRSYRIRRTWPSGSAASRTATGTLDVWKDNTLDPSLSSVWAEQVTQFLPPRLAPLFFFDGERIEQLADPEQSAEALRAAVGALLGVDLVDQLQTDLDTLLRRRRVSEAAQNDERIPRAEQRVKEMEDRRDKAVQTAAALKNELGRAQLELQRIEQQYLEQGGGAVEERRAVESRREAAVANCRLVREQMRMLALTNLPLALLQPLLERSAQQLEAAHRVAADRSASVTLRAAGERLRARLKASGADPAVLGEVEAWLGQEAPQLPEEVPSAASSLANPAVAARMRAMLNEHLPVDRSSAAVLHERLAEVQAEVDEHDRTLTLTPDTAAIAELIRQREAAKVEVGVQQRGHSAAITAADDAETEVRREERELQKLLEVDRLARGEADDARRFARHTEAVQMVLQKFAIALRRRHLARLQSLILESYTALMRKTALAKTLEIDPETFELCLSDAAGRRVEPGRLSAGERQLLAVAILWAMARASNRPLPVVVDTPLGRLDGIHRHRLVERYFPHAAGQVILFSTDEEVDAPLYQLLKPHVARSYRLEHDEVDGTRIEKGYPFAEKLDRPQFASTAGASS